jgi:hypothetical protein
MSETNGLHDGVTASFAPLVRGFDLIAAAAPAFVDTLDFDRVADETLSMDRDDRFDSSAATVGVTGRVAPRIGAAFLDELAASVQRELYLRGLLASDAGDHMVLAAALQVARDSLDNIDDATDSGQLRSALLALGARLYRTAHDGTLTDEGVRDVALAEYNSHAAIGDPLDEHPDSVAPLHVRADLRVYGAVLAYDALDLPVESGASLAAESESDFADILEGYGVEPTETE